MFCVQSDRILSDLIDRISISVREMDEEEEGEDLSLCREVSALNPI